MRYPLASRIGSGLFWWVIYAQQTWRDLTKPLDLFAGSCSTLVAVRHLGQGRKAVGFEVREEQCEAAARRLSQGVLDFGDAS